MPTAQWDIFEIALKGPSTGNPFVDVDLSAQFIQDDRQITVPGFYDDAGIYHIRFMPDSQGPWRYEVHSNHPDLNGNQGQFDCIAPQPGNRGPVRVQNTFHFVYADGMPYRQIGTTCYAWTHQPAELQLQTLQTLKTSPFNKMRMCLFPKRYTYNMTEPPLYPYQGSPPAAWDFTRFNPAYFQHQEQQIARLRDLGIEADVILLHPYDKGHWGFDRMPQAADEQYLKYVVARLSAYRNVWWSLANEYDFLREKIEAQWDRYIQLVHDSDPHHHLLSIHNGKLIYNQTNPAITHASIQNGSAVEEFGRAILYRDVYRKPIVFDEVKYEGNLPQRWGNLSAEEMVHRFWQGVIAGTYVGHGETYLHPADIIWWSKGGTLHGQSPARLHFLKQILNSAPLQGLEPIDKWQDVYTAGSPAEYYLIYFGNQRPVDWIFELPRAGLNDGMIFAVEILDTWNITIVPVPETFTIVTNAGYRYRAAGDKKIALSGNPYLALRIRRVGGDTLRPSPGPEVD